MASNYFKIKRGLNLENTASSVSAKGDISYNSSTDKLELYNGAVDPLVNEAKASTLTNKSIDAATNTISNIANTNISSSAAIDYSKLNLSDSIVNADINSSAAIVYSKLSLSDSIVNADINSSAAIAYSKLNLSASIVNADIAAAAAIVVSKLASGTANQALLTDSGGTTTQWGTLQLGGGGTGATSKSGAFDALSPMSASGDIIYGGTSGTGTRLVKGSDGQVLTLASGVPSWAGVPSATPNVNFLLNSNFDIWQRGTSITGIANGSSTYGPDRWYAKNSLGTNGVLRIDQTTGVTDGSKYGCSVKISTAPTAAQANGCELYQTLENSDSLQLYNQTASFQVKVKALNNVNQVGVQFFYKTTEAKVDTAIGSEQLFTVNSSTFTTCSISGQAIGSSQTTSGSVGVRIRITAVSSGNTYDINNGFVAEQSIVNIGSTSITYRRAGTNYSDEVMQCQRFYEVLTFSGYVCVAQCFSTSQAIGGGIFFRPKRVAPSATLGGGAIQALTANAGATTGTTSTNSVNLNGLYLSVASGSGLVAGNATALQCTSGNSTITLDAEI